MLTKQQQNPSTGRPTTHSMRAVHKHTWFNVGMKIYRDIDTFHTHAHTTQKVDIQIYGDIDYLSHTRTHNSKLTCRFTAT